MTNTETKDPEVVEEFEVEPMVKRATIKDDGRFLFFYTFPDTEVAAADSEEDHV